MKWSGTGLKDLKTPTRWSSQKINPIKDRVGTTELDLGGRSYNERLTGKKIPLLRGQVSRNERNKLINKLCGVGIIHLR